MKRPFDIALKEEKENNLKKSSISLMSLHKIGTYISFLNFKLNLTCIVEQLYKNKKLGKFKFQS